MKRCDVIESVKDEVDEIIPFHLTDQAEGYTVSRWEFDNMSDVEKKSLLAAFRAGKLK